MTYRIRYNQTGGTGQEEALVEATNPTEALVKFCHTADAGVDPDRLRQRVVSVCAEDLLDVPVGPSAV